MSNSPPASSRSVALALEVVSAEAAGVTVDAWLSCVAALRSADPSTAIRGVPEDVTLDALWRVAHALGYDLDVWIDLESRVDPICPRRSPRGGRSRRGSYLPRDASGQSFPGI